MIEAATIACCDEFVRRLPDGYDTMVGECGVKPESQMRIQRDVVEKKAPPPKEIPLER